MGGGETLASLRRRLTTRPVDQRAQIVKTVAAAVIAWVLAVHVFDIAQGVPRAVGRAADRPRDRFRTLKRGVQQVGASVLACCSPSPPAAPSASNALSLGLVCWWA